MSSIDKRNAKRRKTLLGAILYGQTDKVWHCRVSDLSSTGARLKVPFDIKAGEKFLLRIAKFDGIHQCEVMWADNGFIGVNFLRSGGAEDLEFNEALNIFESLDEQAANKEARRKRLRSVLSTKFSSLPNGPGLGDLSQLKLAG